MVDKTFGGCTIDLEGEARERQSTMERSSGQSPERKECSTSPEVEKVRKQCREIVEEGRGIF